jgi:xylulokinase
VLASILAKPVMTLATQEGSAYGAALLGMVGTGQFTSVPEACRATIAVTATCPPDENVALYQKGHRVYQALYPAVQGALRSQP